MLIDPVEKIANAVLYEGYILYPYQATAVKNRQRFNFGALYPSAHCRAQSGADADAMQIECLVSTGRGADAATGQGADAATGQGADAATGEGADATVEARVRFLHLQSRDVFRLASPAGALDGAAREGADWVAGADWAAGADWVAAARSDRAAHSAADSDYELVDSLVVAGHNHQTWQEAVERDIVAAGLSLADLAARPVSRIFTLPGSQSREPLAGADGSIVGRVIRRQRELTGVVAFGAERLADGLFKLRVTITNSTPLAASAASNRDEVLLATFISTHAILRVAGGEFVSLLEPPEALRSAAAACRNVGAWPVLAGDPGQRDRLLASPIILYDYPRVAPESSGDWCDGAEIDEMLMLRVMTLTGDEKLAMRDVDRRAREILERAESMSEDQMLKLHGALRGVDRGGGALRGVDRGGGALRGVDRGGAARSGEEAAR